LTNFQGLQMLWWYTTCISSVGSASAESHSAAAPASAKSSTAATAASKPAAKSSTGAPTSAAAAVPAAETTTPAATETATITAAAVTSSPAAAAESAAGPISPAAKHRVEAGAALGRRRPVFIVAAAESSALESTRRPLGLKTAEADGIHAVAAGVELAQLAHHLYEK
jgi:cytoskeletal protein RodZ